LLSPIYQWLLALDEHCREGASAGYFIQPESPALLISPGIFSPFGSCWFEARLARTRATRFHRNLRHFIGCF